MALMVSAGRLLAAAAVIGILKACAPVAAPPIEDSFSLVDQGKYKDEQQKSLARQQAGNDCKAKALTASALVEKTVAAEGRGRESQLRAREKADQMYAATFGSCMNGYGYIRG